MEYRVDWREGMRDTKERVILVKSGDGFLSFSPALSLSSLKKGAQEYALTVTNNGRRLW